MKDDKTVKTTINEGHNIINYVRMHSSKVSFELNQSLNSRRYKVFW